MANTYPKIAILAAPVAKMAKYQGSKWQLPVPQRRKLNPDLGLHFPKQVKGLQRGEVVQVGGCELLAK